jgi:hypothetical protein
MSVWNGALRFAIELTALAGIAAGGWVAAADPWRWVLVFGLPVLAAAVWGRFRVPGDPGPAPVAVRGWVRLVIETVVLGGGVAGLAVALGSVPASVFAVVIFGHYVIAWERVRWLLER